MLPEMRHTIGNKRHVLHDMWIILAIYFGSWVNEYELRATEPRISCKKVELVRNRRSGKICFLVTKRGANTRSFWVFYGAATVDNFHK